MCSGVLPVAGESSSVVWLLLLSLLLLSLLLLLLVGCKHRASEVLLYIGGRGFVCQIIEPVTFARCAFIFALRNIALDGYLEIHRNI